MSDTENSSTPSVKPLAALIDYQAGTVSSRTLIKKPATTVTIFAFDQGEGLSEHTAPFDAMVYAVDGEVEIRISGQPYRLKTGDTVTMPANQPHSLRAITPFKMLLIMAKA